MTDNATAYTALRADTTTLPQVVTHPVVGNSEAVADGPIVVVTANSEQGLEHAVIDIRAAAPDAFPPRLTTTRTVTDQRSFITELAERPLLNDEARRSTLWANRGKGTVTAIYNDNPQNAGDEYADRGDRLILQFVEDPNWRRFLKAADAQFHDQSAFADLIESVGHLIVSHPAAELMEIVESIRASSKGSFESKPNRANGSLTFNYSEEISAQAGTRQRPLEIPTEVTFRVRKFEDYPEIEVACWFRFQIRSGDLGLTLVPQPYEHRIQESWIDVVDELSNEIGHSIYASNL